MVIPACACACVSGDVCVHYVFGSETNMMCSVEYLSTKNEEGMGEHNYLRWKNEEGGRQGKILYFTHLPHSWLKNNKLYVTLLSIK